MSAAAETEGAGTRGRINYLDPSMEHSLYRNGAVLTRRDADGNDAGTKGVVVDRREVPILDARALESADRRGVARNGFELLDRPLPRADLDFFQHKEVVGDYYRECAEIVRAATGAARVLAFDHNVRSASGKQGQRRIEGGQQVQGPAHVAHGDYTLTGGPERLRLLAKPPSANDTLREVLEPGASLLAAELVDRALGEGGRFALINVWRNIAEEPVVTHPLALCDAQTLAPEDLVVFEIHYADRIGENYFARHAERHRWYYYPEMTRDEALLIKQWDSAGTLARSKGERGDADVPDAPCTFSLHSAFADPGAPPDAPDRWSIEVRCAAVYD